MRVVDIMMAFPGILMALVVVAVVRLVDFLGAGILHHADGGSRERGRRRPARRAGSHACCCSPIFERIADQGSSADDGPWPRLHVELGYRPEQSTITVLRAETAINVTGGLPALASVMASAASAFTMRYEGLVAVVVAPFVARRLAAEGWSKDDVRRALYKDARVPVPMATVVAAHDGARVAVVDPRRRGLRPSARRE